MAQGDFQPLGGGGAPVRKVRANVYTVMLALSLLAILMGCLFLSLEIRDYEGKIFQPAPLSHVPQLIQGIDGSQQV